jgi:hypothetical protein
VQGEREEGEGGRGGGGQMQHRHFLNSRNTNHLLDTCLHLYFLFFLVLGNFCAAMSKDTHYSLDGFF